MKKKSQIQTQFNWIFVLIVGGVIIVFFTNIVIKQMDISQKNLATKVIGDLETIATGATIAKGTAQVLKKPDIDLIFDCYACNCKYSMGASDKYYGEKIIFSPSKIIGRKMIAWTLDWSAPYRVTNFLFLTSPQVNYIIIAKDSSTGHGDYVNETLPSAIHKEYYEGKDFVQASNSLHDNNYPVVKIVYIVTSGSDCTAGDGLISADKFKDWDLKREDLTAVCIYGIGDNFNKGKVQFFKVDKDWKFIKDGTSLDLLGDESLFAAIFSHNYDIFSCNMQNSFKRLELIAKIYNERTSDLTCTSSMGPTSLYNQCINWLTALQKNATYLSKNASKSYNSLYKIQSNLSYYNTQLQIRSCPEIY